MDYIKDPSSAEKYDVIMTFGSPTFFFLLSYACSYTKFMIYRKVAMPKRQSRAGLMDYESADDEVKIIT